MGTWGQKLLKKPRPSDEAWEFWGSELFWGPGFLECPYLLGGPYFLRYFEVTKGGLMSLSGSEAA